MPTVLITNNTLGARAGTEMYVRDVALALLRRGWQPVAYSSMLGDAADELRRLSVPVVDDPRKLPAPPDLIHAHHHLDAMAAIAAWPGVPVIAFCHGWSPWEETPFRHPQIVRYVAVDELCRERLIVEHGVPQDQVEVLLNFVDLHRFAPRVAAPLGRPRRALIFSNYLTENSPTTSAIREACARLGITLEIVGVAAGRSTATPETVLAQADMVFAKGRCALEALAVGCGVVVCDHVGLAGLVTPENFDRFRSLNFGFRLMVTSRCRLAADDIVTELERWNTDNVASVSARVRRECGMEQAMDRLIAQYELALANRTTADPAALCAGSIAMSGYLLSLGGRFKTFHQQYAALAELESQSKTAAESASQAEAAALAEKIALLHAECAARDAQIQQLKSHNLAQREKLASLETKCASRTEKIAQMQKRLSRFAGVRRFLPRWLAGKIE